MKKIGDEASANTDKNIQTAPWMTATSKTGMDSERNMMSTMRKIETMVNTPMRI